MVRITIDLNENMVKAVDEHAEKTSRTRSGMIRHIINTWRIELKRQEKGQIIDVKA